MKYDSPIAISKYRSKVLDDMRDGLVVESSVDNFDYSKEEYMTDMMVWRYMN